MRIISKTLKKAIISLRVFSDFSDIFQIYQICKSQLISYSPLHFKISFTFEKCLQPKNQVWAENGDGCGHSKTICLLVSISSFFFCAKAHRSKKITPSFLSEIVLMTASVNLCRPISLCELGWSFLTVRLAFNRKTPCLAQGIKSPVFQIFQTSFRFFRSSLSSLKIFFNDGGCLTQFWTEKHNPWASHSPW